MIEGMMINIIAIQSAGEKNRIYAKASNCKMDFKDRKQYIVHYLFNNFIDIGLVSSADEFSLNYCGTYRGYYHQTKSKNFDLTIYVAVDCLINVRRYIKKFKKLRDTIGSLNDDKIMVLEDAEEKLCEYLRVKYRVAEIVEETSTIYDDDDFYGVVIT